MKYLKITMTVFVISLCLAAFGVNAREYTEIVDITIPSWSQTFTSKQVDKGEDWMYTQKVKKVSATDNFSGDGRAINGRIKGMFKGMITTSWKRLTQGDYIDFGDGTEVEGGWKLQLKSNKVLVTTAKATFRWDLGSILYSPYPKYGSR